MVVIVGHDMNIIKELCDHVYVLDAGKNVVDGTAEFVLKNDQVKTAYLGI